MNFCFFLILSVKKRGTKLVKREKYDNYHLCKCEIAALKRIFLPLEFTSFDQQPLTKRKTEKNLTFYSVQLIRSINLFRAIVLTRC